MSQETNLVLFGDYFKVEERLNVGVVMVKLDLSRPTATELIARLLTDKKIIPVFQIGDAHKWYKRTK